MDDFVDLGNGYDLEDSFIDNDEAVNSRKINYYLQ